MLAVYLTGAVLDSGRMDLRELTPTLLDEFESHLYSQSTLAPRSASGRFSVLVAMLRHLRETMPSALHPGMPARLRFIGRRPRLPIRSSTPTLRHCLSPRKTLPQPRGGDSTFRAKRCSPAVRIPEPGAGRWKRPAVGSINRRASCANRMSWRAWALSIAPRQDSGFADYTRCCTRTKPISPRLRYCSSSIPDSSRKQYAVFIPTACATHSCWTCRDRLPQAPPTRPGTFPTPSTRWQRHHTGRADPPRLATDETGPSAHRRQQSPVGERAASRKQPGRQLPRRLSVLWRCQSGEAVWGSRSRRRTTGGEPATVAQNLQSRVLSRHRRAVLPLLAQGHSREVAADRYADIPALREVHEKAITDGLSEALAEVVQLRVLTTEHERQLEAAPERAPQLAGIRAEQVPTLLSGEMDLWLSACLDFTDSPFGTKGQPCPVPFWNCLGCSNAIVTSRKLPAVLKLLDHLTAQREEMSAHNWAAMHGETWNRILTRDPAGLPPVRCRHRQGNRRSGQTSTKSPSANRRHRIPRLMGGDAAGSGAPSRTVVTRRSRCPSSGGAATAARRRRFALTPVRRRRVGSAGRPPPTQRRGQSAPDPVLRGR